MPILRGRIDGVLQRLEDLERDAIRAYEKASRAHHEARSHMASLASESPSSQVIHFRQFGEDPWTPPTRVHLHDAGWDIRINKGVKLAPGASAMVPTGTTAEIPEGYFGLLAIRSGLGSKGITLLNGVGVIDHGYEGEIKLVLANFGSEEWSAEPGNRIAQLIVTPCVTGPLTSVNTGLVSYADDRRGVGGFGSTGLD